VGPRSLPVFALLSVFLSPALACKRQAAPTAPGPPLTTLGPVSVRDLTPSGEAPAHVDVEALARALRARLLATGQFAADAADAGAPRAVTRADVLVTLEGAEVDDKGVARAHVLVHLETRPASAPGAISERLEGTGERGYAVPRPSKAGKDEPVAAPRDALYEGLVQRVAGDLFTELGARRRLHEGSPEALHAALASDGGELRLEAISAVRERRITNEAPALLALLDDPDETTRDAALGALITLGDRRAVPALTHSRSLRDRHELHKIIEALAILGGQEADDYLSFVASSHDDEAIRAEAAAARARLMRRADAVAKPP
jgi:hypothetical protein